MAAVGNAIFSCQVNHGIHHVARACKAETDVVRTVEYALGSFDEILRTLLHGDTSQVGNHLLLRTARRGNLRVFLTERINGIVHGHALTRILVILMDDGLARQLTHAHDTVGMIHTVLLDAIDRGFTLPRERSKAVACTWMQRGFPLTILAWTPAG